MTPIGPFGSPWAPAPVYHVMTAVRGVAVHAVVRDGVQPADGLLFPDRRGATAWLAENGYVRLDPPAR